MDTLEASISRISEILAEVPDWLISLVVIVIVTMLALAIHRRFFHVLRRLTRERDLFWRSMVERLSGPARLGILMLGLVASSAIAPFDPNDAAIVRHALLIGLMVLVGWMLQIALYIWTTVHLRRFKL